MFGITSSLLEYTSMCSVRLRLETNYWATVGLRYNAPPNMQPCRPAWNINKLLQKSVPSAQRKMWPPWPGTRCRRFRVVHVVRPHQPAEFWLFATIILKVLDSTDLFSIYRDVLRVCSLFRVGITPPYTKFWLPTTSRSKVDDKIDFLVICGQLDLCRFGVGILTTLINLTFLRPSVQNTAITSTLRPPPTRC